MAILAVNCFVVSAQTSNEYTADDAAAFEIDLAAGTYDVMILTTSGGVYDINYPSIPKSMTIKGQDGLEAKPILKNTANTSSSSAILRINGSSERETIVFENIEFDGSGAATNPLIIRSDVNSHIVFKNCYIHDALNSNGAIRMNTAGASIDMQNTLVANSTKRIIHFYTTDKVFGDANLTNCTFSNIAGSLVFFRSSGGLVASGANTTIDHCTFSNINSSSDGVFTFRSMSGIVSVKNSIFDAVTGTINGAIAEVDYCYLAGMDPAVEGTNSIETAPVFADVANRNFALSNKTDLIAGDMLTLGDLSWYNDVEPPKVFAELIKIDPTHVKLQFNEIVDIATASSSANYTLSGTAGFSGNPTMATIETNGKDVILTVSDLSTMTALQTVIIAVANVTDVLGNIISEDNTATYTFLDETAPIVSVTAQSVTNDIDQVAIAQSNEVGMICLVMDGVPQSTLAEIMAAINSGNAVIQDVSAANMDVSISTAGLSIGTYYIYAVDLYENLSDKSTNAITVNDNTAPEISIVAQEVINSKFGIVLSQSNEAGAIYIILDGEAQTTVEEFEAAIVAKKGAKVNVSTADVEVSLSAAELIPGNYRAYAVDVAGNISAISVNSITVTQSISRTRYYAAVDATKLQEDIVSAVDGDIFILTESGGQYKMNEWTKLSSAITIMAAEGLEQRPIINKTQEKDTYQTLRLNSAGASLRLKGLEFAGSNNAAYPVKYHIRIQEGIGSYYVIAEDCYFRGDLKAGGTIVKAYNLTHGDVVAFRNCIFDGGEIALAYDGLSSSPGAGFDKIEVTNCTFNNITKSAFAFANNIDLTQNEVVFDHCTFNNVGGVDNLALQLDTLYNASIKNSIFANSISTQAWNLHGNETSQSTTDYCNFFNHVQPLTIGSAVVGNNIYDKDPMFADADNGDFTLGNNELYSLGSDGLPLGDKRWADIYAPKVLSAMQALTDVTLKLTFDEAIEAVSAENAANYYIGGTAGFTGNPTSVTLLSTKSVEITMENFADAVGKTIEITVSNVVDLTGNMTSEDNVATYTVVSKKPVVTVAEQTLTNGSGQKVLVSSNQDSGEVYIVLDGVAQGTVDEINTAIAAKQGASANVVAINANIEISASGIQTGVYYAYAINADGLLSDKSMNTITIIDGILPIVSAELQSANNGENDFVVAQSNEEGTVYIIMDGEQQAIETDFASAISANKGSSAVVTAIDTDIQISTKDLIAGIYYAYSVDMVGNISAKSLLPINITAVAATSSINSAMNDKIKAYSFENNIFIESDLSIQQYVNISDLMGRTVVSESLTSNYNKFTMNQKGVYILTVSSKTEILQTVKLIIK